MWSALDVVLKAIVCAIRNLYNFSHVISLRRVDCFFPFGWVRRPQIRYLDWQLNGESTMTRTEMQAASA